MRFAARWLGLLVLCLYFAHGAQGLNNGAALTPPLGWSTWNTFHYNVSHDLILSTAKSIVTSGLLAAGYNYVLIDDGWPECLVFRSDGGCITPAPRDAQGRIRVDPNKFPHGLKQLADEIHAMNLKLGIYTAVSNVTCGGFTASLNHEYVDAQSFASWGMDFVKYDTCNEDCGLHDGCMTNSTARMRDGLNATGRPIVYYVDAGNPSSPQRLFNPFHRNVENETMIKVANVWQELVWVWGANTANMWKSWFDRQDNWMSLLDNLHHQIGLAMYQSKGAYNMPDMVTIGQGGMTQGQYRADMFLWAVLGAPIILGNDVRNMDNFTLSLLTAPEVLAVDQDPDCVQGSLLREMGAGEVWGKPLHDGTFAVVLLNKLSTPQNITFWLQYEGYCDGGSCNGGDLYPAFVNPASIRDLWQQRDLGVYTNAFSAIIPGQDAMMIKVTPLSSGKVDQNFRKKINQ